MRRAIIIVLDGVGIGELPDANFYHDEGSNTLMNIKKMVPSTMLSNMSALGLGHIDGENLFEKAQTVTGCYGKMAEKSKGKDTTTGHWEIAGITIDEAFPTYPNGFPDEILKPFCEKIGREVLGNCVASGTEIIERLGDEHVKTGKPIVYTSADSVFQIAAHEDVISIDELYKMCAVAREMLTGEHNISRVIARPFTGTTDAYTRTKNRHDFSLEPTGKTLLDYAKEANYDVVAVGKIEDIFAGRGVTKAIHTKDNAEGIAATINCLKEDFSKQQIIFTNLVDFDMLYGHRNNPTGFSDALMYFDAKLPEIIKEMKYDDLLFITADHGCDPTTASTDHSREHVPLLVYGKNIHAGLNLGTRSSFGDLAATIADYLGLLTDVKGESFLGEIVSPIIE